VPLTGKAGYALPIKWGLGLQADLAFGVLFSKTEHYDTAVNMLMDRRLSSRTNSLFAGAKLYATYTFPGDFVKLYAGGGADVIIETGGPIPLPLVEAGLSFKPLSLFGYITRRKAEEQRLWTVIRR
jgi:hypothetical protein